MRLFLILLALSSCALAWFHVRLTPEDIASYHHLMQESTEKRTRHTLEDTPAYQTRQNVQKDIWTQGETQHYQIQSETSLLTLSPKTATEELHRIHCTLPNDLILTADLGLYTYPSHQFIAQKNCHLIQKDHSIYSPRIQFDLSQETVTCENPKGQLNQNLNFIADQLLWNKKENKLYLTGQVQLFSQLQDKESFALADSLTYDLFDKTISLTAKKKVLFWQKGLALSATEVFIHKDQTVEGKGDVHFSFDLDEQNTIDQFFKHYL